MIVPGVLMVAEVPVVVVVPLGVGTVPVVRSDSSGEVSAPVLVVLVLVDPVVDVVPVMDVVVPALKVVVPALVAVGVGVGVVV